MERLYDVALVVTLWATGLGLGLRLGIPAMVRPVRRVRLVASVVALDAVAIPLLVWGLANLFSVPEGYSTGLLLVGAAAGGPLGITASRIAGADTALAIALVIVLELANAIAIPFWASVLLPAGVAIPYGEMIVSLIVLVVLPLGIGGVLAARSPGLAGSAGRFDVLASAGLAAVIVLSIARNAPEVADASGSWVLIVSIVTVGASLAAGWAVAGPGTAAGATAALVVGVRANGLALAIARLSFPDDDRVPAAIVVFGLVSITAPVAAAVLWRRRRTAWAGSVRDASA